MKRIQSTITMLLFSLLAFSQGVIGDWSGTLSVGPQSLRLVFHITQTDNGITATMDSPDQGADGIAMSHATFTDNVLTLELRVAGITYKGTPEGDTLKGTFSQSGQSFPLVLTRSSKATVANKTNAGASSPQAAETPNTVYTETPVSLPIASGDLKGTLTLPKNHKKGALVLIIAGSGPTDRDGNNPAMRCDTYKQMAHNLSKAGIASLRYDKRGIAQSAATVEREDDLLFDDYVNDAKAWLQWAKKDKRFTDRIIIGHSEGSMIGMLAMNEADKFISIAGPGRPANDLLKEQLSAAKLSTLSSALSPKALGAADSCSLSSSLAGLPGPAMEMNLSASSVANMPIMEPSLCPMMIRSVKRLSFLAHCNQALASFT